MLVNVNILNVFFEKILQFLLLMAQQYGILLQSKQNNCIVPYPLYTARGWKPIQGVGMVQRQNAAGLFPRFFVCLSPFQV
jgi:hypothetical protein